jgi:MacB-like periplasmic core domain
MKVKHKEALPGYWSEAGKRRLSSVSIFLWEIRSAISALARERAFTAFALILIMLGAGLLTTMFALVDAVSMRKLDVPDPDSLFGIFSLRDGRRAGIPISLFDRLRENLEGADSLFGMSNTYIPVTHEGRTEILFTESMTGHYYRTMGVQPLLGRALTPADDGPVAVISDSYWRRMGKDPAIIGRVIRAGSVSLTIVGVVPAKAHQLWRFMTTDLVVPFRIGMLLEGTPPEKVSREIVYVTARLMKGVTFHQVQHRLATLGLARLVPKVSGASDPARP